MTVETLKSDIPYSLAMAAHSGTSFMPERRAASEQSEYAQTLISVYEDLKSHANTPEKLATLDEEFARFREGYRKRYTAYLASNSRIVSTMIAGRLTFPFARWKSVIELHTHDSMN
jgi:hypothetical protein